MQQVVDDQKESHSSLHKDLSNLVSVRAVDFLLFDQVNLAPLVGKCASKQVSDQALNSSQEASKGICHLFVH